jgi:hypothetical protein
VLSSVMPAMADNRVRRTGGATARLDDTTVEEGLQHLPGWERRGNENLALSSLAKGEVPACGLPLAQRIPEFDEPALAA